MTDIRAQQLGVYVLCQQTSESIEVSQLGIYVLCQQPAETVYASQVAAQVLGAAETSTGFHDLKAHALGIYVLCRDNGDRRELRAWTFTQDDHIFYVLQIGSQGTLVYDRLSGQWSQWKSPGYVQWRGADGCDWEGYNICCDTESGKLWEIDPLNRLDYGTTAIESKVTGYITHRFRQHAPCFMAELAVSEGAPPTGIAEGAVSITLRTSDDDGFNFVDHGSVLGEGATEDITVRWYGLGLMKQPGRLFEIVDTGYARRIDALDIEVGGAD